MVTTVITLLTLCVGIVFIFMISVESLDRSLKKHEYDNENEIKVINNRFNIEYENVEKLKVDLFKLKEKNIQLERQVKGLELQILKLKDIDSSKYY